jgi:hypothetical protein
MLSSKEFEDFLTGGVSKIERQMHIYTGRGGADMINHAIAVENSVGYVNWLLEAKKIDKETLDSLIMMLKSEDRDNYNIAILAIEQLAK